MDETKVYDNQDELCSCGHTRWAHHNFWQECIARKDARLCECEEFKVAENNSPHDVELA